MAKARAIINRRKAVGNIRKITRTMQLIATARFQRSHQRAVNARAYTSGVAELAGELGSLSGQVSHPLLRANRGTGRSVMLVVTSNRGLCGGYNANVLRTAIGALEACRRDGLDVDHQVAGKKGIGYFRFLRRSMAETYTQFEDRPAYADVNAIAQRFIDLYEENRVDRVDVVYMRFLSAGSQRPEVLRLLPTSQISGAATEHPAMVAAPVPAEHYDFSPDAEALLADLLPMTVKVRLYQCLMDAAVSEQVARMVAMKSATDAAGDMIKYLTQRYNRARQSQITLELLDIMGGTEALA